MFTSIENSILLVISLLCCLTMTDCTDAARATSFSSKNGAKANSKQLETFMGGWYLIEGEYSGQQRVEESPFQFKLFGEKYFANLMKDEAGNWKEATSGTFDLADGQYREYFEFSTNPDFIGLTVYWNYTINGDTLFMEGPLKIVTADGMEAPELAGGYNSMKEVRIRAK